VARSAKEELLFFEFANAFLVSLDHRGDIRIGDRIQKLFDLLLDLLQIALQCSRKYASTAFIPGRLENLPESPSQECKR
jgi:hypothetical protein